MADDVEYNKLIPLWKSITDKISQGSIAPVYLLHGEEEFLIKEHIKLLTETIVSKEERDFNLEFIDGTVTSPEDIIAISSTYPFLGSKKVLVIQNYPALSPKAQSFSINQALELFEKGEIENNAKAIFSYMGLETQDLQNMTKYEFTNHIQNKEDNALTDSEIETLGKVYSYLIEKTEILASSLKEEIPQSDLLENYITNNQSSFSCLILVSTGKVNKTNSLYKLISKKGEIIEFSIDKKNLNMHLDEIHKSLKLKGITITQSALKKLTDKTGANLRQINKEIEKITDFLGTKKIIDEKDIELLVSRIEAEKIYELSDALAERKKEKALEVLNNILKDEIFPLQIMAVITTRFRFLLQSKLLMEEGFFPKVNSYPIFTKKIYPELKEKAEKLLSSEKNYNLLKQHPFVIFKVIQQSMLFSMAEIKSGLKKILDRDKDLKLSSHPPKIILELLVLELI